MDRAAPMGFFLRITPTEKHQTDAFAPEKRPDLSFQAVGRGFESLLACQSSLWSGVNSEK